MATVVHSASRQQATTRNPLVLWHLLSLDAPTVSALWTIAVARSVHVALPLAAPVAMFLAVWMLYAADRLLDALQPSSQLEARHHFHHRHRNAFLSGIALGAIALVFLDRYGNPAAIHLYTLLAALLAAWFLIIHARLSPRRLPKELAVGIFFAAAVFIPTVARRPDLRLALAPHAILAAATCALNCLFIYAWEHPGPRPHAHWTTRLATTHIQLLATLILAASLIAASLTHNRLDIACALSAAALLALHKSRHRIAPTTLRAAADLALLSPVLLFLR